MLNYLFTLEKVPNIYHFYQQQHSGLNNTIKSSLSWMQNQIINVNIDYILAVATNTRLEYIMLLNLPNILSSNSSLFYLLSPFYSFLFLFIFPQVNNQAADNYKLHSAHSITLVAIATMLKTVIFINC